MKRINILVITLFILLSFVACTSKEYNKATNPTETTLTTEIQTTNLTIEKNTFENKENNQNDDIGGGELTLQKYRSIYYCIPSPFWDIVDENSRENIYGEYWEQPYSEINIMRMRIFVEEYNVPREKFDAANAEWARIVKEKLYGTPVVNPQDYANQEFDEIYNADIIYTFDNEIINEYYLSHDYPYCYESEYEEAVENGLYTPQTTKIIDLAKLKNELFLFNHLKEQKKQFT